MVMAVLIIFPVILQMVINLRMLSIGGQGRVRDATDMHLGRKIKTKNAINSSH